MSIYALIPLLPLAAAVVLALNGRRLEGKGQRIVVPTIALSFALSILAFVEVLTRGPIEVSLYRLIESGNLVVDLGLYIDQLTVLLLLLVTGVSTIVQIYSSRYMIGDSRHSRFFAVTSLFTSAMMLVVMSRNLLMTYMSWEIMGICSYLLISHYAARRSAHRAATKVFLVNSIADVGFGLGVILTFRTFGTLDIPQVLAAADGADPGRITLISLLLFMGAVAKSAQMPFHVWLPLAMEAPTPVSALIHAATMVNAGPFLLVRLSPLLVLSPTAMAVIAVVGGTTALFAALVSTTQTDVKRTLAYSTISQLGFMTLLCGVGAFVAAIFHLIAHGFFKAFLFLSTGNVLARTHRFHAESGAGDPSRTMRPVIAGTLVLSAVPPLVIFSRPYEALWISQGFSQASLAYWVVGLATVFFTSVYLFRGVTTLFRHGPPNARGSAQVRPTFFSPAHVAGIVAATASALVVLLAAWTWFSGFLSPVVGHSVASAPASGTGPAIWLLVPLAVAVAGWSYAYSPLHERQALHHRACGLGEARLRLLSEQGVLRRDLRCVRRPPHDRAGALAMEHGRHARNRQAGRGRRHGYREHRTVAMEHGGYAGDRPSGDRHRHRDGRHRPVALQVPGHGRARPVRGAHRSPRRRDWPGDAGVGAANAPAKPPGDGLLARRGTGVFFIGFLDVGYRRFNESRPP